MMPFASPLLFSDVGGGTFSAACSFDAVADSIAGDSGCPRTSRSRRLISSRTASLWSWRRISSMPISRSISAFIVVKVRRMRPNHKPNVRRAWRHTFGSKNQQRNHTDECQLRKADIKHSCPVCAGPLLPVRATSPSMMRSFVAGTASSS